MWAEWLGLILILLMLAVGIGIMLREAAREVPLAASNTAIPKETEQVATAQKDPADRNDRRSSWVVRHWRGDLSLAKSYWLVGSLSGLAVGGLGQAAQAIGESDFWTDAPRGAAALTLALCLVIPTVSLWQSIGIWRSASHHVARTGRRFWARFAQGVVAFGLVGSAASVAAVAPLAWHLGHVAIAGDDLDSPVIRVVGRGHEVELKGPIAFGTAVKLETVIAATPGVHVLRLESMGGRLGEARRMARLVRERRLTTYTATGCYSGCTLIFVAGAERVLGTNAKLGFHQAGLQGVAHWLFADEEARDADSMRRAGITAEFVRRAFETPSDDLWFPSPNELIDAHVISRVSEGYEFGYVSANREKELADLEDDFSKTRLMRVIRELYPRSWQLVIARFKLAVTNEEPLAPVKDFLAGETDRLVAWALPRASSLALLRYGRYRLQLLTELLATDPSTCVGNEFDDASASARALQLISPAATNELVEVKADLLESALRNPAPSLGPRERDAILHSLFAGLGTDQALMASKAVALSQPAKSCAVLIALYRGILQQPPSSAARVMQALVAP